MDALRKSLDDREWDKFELNVDGETAVRTITKGNVSFSGLSIGGRISEVTLNDATWVALPATALAQRNAISIQNTSTVEIKIQYDNATVGYVGVKVGVGGERFYDVTDAITIYGKSSNGAAIITIEELA